MDRMRYELQQIRLLAEYGAMQEVRISYSDLTLLIPSEPIYMYTRQWRLEVGKGKIAMLREAEPDIRIAPQAGEPAAV